MALISLRQLLDYAAENDFGMPAFNVNNMEQVHAIMQAADETDSPVIMLDGHMDEVGFMVQHVNSRGFVKFVPMGGWWEMRHGCMTCWRGPQRQAGSPRPEA